MRVLSALGVSAEIKPLAVPPAIAVGVEHEMVPGATPPELAAEPEDDPELEVEDVGEVAGELVDLLVGALEVPPLVPVDAAIQQAFVTPWSGSVPNAPLLHVTPLVNVFVTLFAVVLPPYTTDIVPLKAQ